MPSAFRRILAARRDRSRRRLRRDRKHQRRGVRRHAMDDREQLRNVRDPVIIQRLQLGGRPIVDGLQGKWSSCCGPRTSHRSKPISSTTMIVSTTRRRADISATSRPARAGRGRCRCRHTGRMICPVGLFNVDVLRQFGAVCPSGTEFSTGCCVHRGCPPSDDASAADVCPRRRTAVRLRFRARAGAVKRRRAGRGRSPSGERLRTALTERSGATADQRRQPPW